MNARPTEHVVFMPSTMTYSAPAVQHPTTTSRPSGLEALLVAGFRYVASMPRRHAVKTELQRLSDRELSDIGLSRSEIANVFSRDR